MTRHPFNPGELGGDDPTLVGLAEELERSAATTAQPSAGFASRVLAAIDEEPIPPRPWHAAFGVALSAPFVRGLALGGVAVAAVVLAIVVGGLLGPVRPAPGANGSNTPTSSPTQPSTLPTPSAIPSPSPSATSTASPSRGTATSEPSETPGPSESGHPTSSASSSDDHGGGSGSGSGSESGSGSGHSAEPSHS